MAIIKLLPTKDASIYSYLPDKNTGLDEILDVGINQYEDSVTRSLISFDSSMIASKKANITGSYYENMKIYFCNGHTLPSEYSIQLKELVDNNWSNGIDKLTNGNSDTSGITWKKYSASYLPTERLITENQFTIYSDKDINFNLSGSTTYSYSVQIKNDLTINSGSTYLLNLYSKDTHTIYQPYYELRYDDSTYLSSLSGSIVATEPYVTLSSNPFKLYQGHKYRINVSCREKYPTRTFQKVSQYNVKKYLPSTSYYAIRDLKADFYVIDFDTNYTKISLDANGNFFMFDTTNLQTNRFYTIDIKTIVNGNEYIFKDDLYFKIND